MVSFPLLLARTSGPPELVVQRAVPVSRDLALREPAEIGPLADRQLSAARSANAVLLQSIAGGTNLTSGRSVTDPIADIPWLDKLRSCTFSKGCDGCSARRRRHHLNSTLQAAFPMQSESRSKRLSDAA